MKQKTLIICLLTIFCNYSFAGILVEPLLGMNFSKKVETRSKNYTSGSGLSWGGRLGYQKGALQMGVDFLNSSIDMSSGDFDENFKTNEYAAFIGVELPLLFKVYAAYIFAANGNTEVRDNDISLDSGRGGKLGLGFTLLPFVDLNLDYRRITFDDSIKLEAYMLSASLPFDLF
jgi:hypothetical protein